MLDISTVNALNLLSRRTLSENELSVISLNHQIGNYQEIANILSTGRTKIAPYLITERGILSTLGIVQGEGFLQALESLVNQTLQDTHPLYLYLPGIKRSVSWLKKDGIDIGDSLTRQLLDIFVSIGILSEQGGTLIKNKALIPDPVKVSEVHQIFKIVQEVDTSASLSIFADTPLYNEKALLVKNTGLYKPSDLVLVYRLGDPDKLVIGAYPAFYIIYGVLHGGANVQ